MRKFILEKIKNILNLTLRRGRLRKIEDVIGFAILVQDIWFI